jgi:hypothetical protein
MTLKSKLNKYSKKLKVYTYYKDGSFDHRDKKRLKPLTRIRKSVEEVKEAEGNPIEQRVKDWYYDIDKGYSK